MATELSRQKPCETERCRRGAGEVPERCQRGAGDVPERCQRGAREVPEADAMQKRDRERCEIQRRQTFVCT
jgi:hypothetical protein